MSSTFFRPILVEKMWGGRRLAALFGREADDAAAEEAQAPVGEAWLFSWFGAHRTSPACGEAAAALGLRGDEEHPLLIKYIHAKERLSVQVHPDDERAAELEGAPRGKTECWYVLEAEKDAVFWLGLKEGASVGDLESALRSGNSAVEEVLRKVPAVPGRLYPVPAGTVHAIGGGILLAEIQQSSDITYRLWDWERVDPATGRPRELHLEKALASVREDSRPAPVAHEEDDGRGNDDAERGGTGAPPPLLALYSTSWFEVAALRLHDPLTEAADAVREWCGGDEPLIAVPTLVGFSTLDPPTSSPLPHPPWAAMIHPACADALAFCCLEDTTLLLARGKELL